MHRETPCVVRNDASAADLSLPAAAGEEAITAHIDRTKTSTRNRLYGVATPMSGCKLLRHRSLEALMYKFPQQRVECRGGFQRNQMAGILNDMKRRVFYLFVEELCILGRGEPVVFAHNNP